MQVQGPFETSYSLALMNRRLALGLERSPDVAVSIYATEGPGDYRPKEADLAAHPHAALLFERSMDVAFPDVVIRQMYPPRVIDTPGAITCEYFGWEESRIPQAMVDDFNRYLDGIGVMSDFVARRAPRLGRHDVPSGSSATAWKCRIRPRPSTHPSSKVCGPSGFCTSARPFRARRSTCSSSPISRRSTVEAT